MASALALIAVVARRPAAVSHGEIRHPIRHHAPAEPPADDLARLHAAARERHRRQVVPVGKLRQLLARAAHADEVLHAVVVRLEVAVADGPVFAVAVAARRLELVVAEPVALARPAERPPADLTSADPHERLAGRERVRVLVVVHEELVAVFVARVAEALHGLMLEQLLLVAEAPELELVRPHVLGEVAGRHAWRSRLEHQDAQAALGGLFRDPASAGARPHHQHVICRSLRVHDAGTFCMKTCGANTACIRARRNAAGRDARPELVR